MSRNLQPTLVRGFFGVVLSLLAIGGATAHAIVNGFDAESLDVARTRLEGLGARFVHEKDEYGLRWFTFQDPEGNELCVGSHE